MEITSGWKLLLLLMITISLVDKTYCDLSEDLKIFQKAIRALRADLEEIRLEHKNFKNKFEEAFWELEKEQRMLRMLMMNVDIQGTIDSMFSRIIQNEKKIAELKNIFPESNQESEEKGIEDPKYEEDPMTSSSLALVSYPGLLIVGGGSEENKKTVELWAPDGPNSWLRGVHCSLPSTLLERGQYHTQHGNLVCGGFDGWPPKDQQCEKFENGQWEVSHELDSRREGHVMWNSSKGVVLIGGRPGYYSSVLLLDEGKTQKLFDIEYTSDSCGISIEEDDSVLLTGGRKGDEVSSVIKYNLTGKVANFPDLNEGRYFHACASYVNEDNLRVFLVTGGQQGQIYPVLLSSTEVFKTGDEKWSKTGSLPKAITALTAGILDNDIFLLGGCSKYENFCKERENGILVFNKHHGVWFEFGEMKQKRNHATVGVVSVAEYERYCLE